MSLFREKDNRYTKDAEQLDNDATDFLLDLFKEYTKKGYSPREISHVLQLAVFSMELTFVLGDDKFCEKPIEFTIGEIDE